MLPEWLTGRARHERTFVALGLGAVIAAAWMYTVSLAADVDSGVIQIWSGPAGHGGGLASLAIMWTVMMTAMMLPTAWPVIVLFDGARSDGRPPGQPPMRTALFVGGYLGAWTLFSAGAALLQWTLGRQLLMSPHMATTDALLGGVLLGGAGLYQWTPWKTACLRRCRSPLGFLTVHWREGRLGALQMGLRHGAFCVGCCWMLMLVLFVTGTMNVLWMVLLTGLTLAEKVAPAPVESWIRHGSALGLIVWGLRVGVAG